MSLFSFLGCDFLLDVSEEIFSYDDYTVLTTYEKQTCDWLIIMYVDGDNNLQSSLYEDINEIEKAFSNNTIRTMFVKTLIDELTKLFTDNKIPKEKWNILFDEVAIRIVKYFGVKPKIKEKIGNEIIRFSQEKGLDIFVKASVKDESITLGTDFNLVNNFNI